MIRPNSVIPETYQNFKGKQSIRVLQNVLQFTLLVVAILSLTSCEKVIQLDLNSSTSRIVIQGNIYDRPGPYLVKISKSVNFDQSSEYPPVTDAIVQISDNVGQSETLSESTSGTYVTTKLRGIPGRTYSLTVKSGTETYQASAVMPYAVYPDSIYFSSSLFSGEKLTTVRFNDPPVITNYYRLIYFINNIQQKEFYVLDDELFQGATIKYSLHPRDSDIKLVKGDNVTVWLESVDHGVYEYFRTATSEDGQSTSPANPVSNISNGALGYFNACSVRKISSTVSY